MNRRNFFKTLIFGTIVTPSITELVINNINKKRLLLTIEKYISSCCEPFIGKMNNEENRERIKLSITNYTISSC